MRGAPQEMLVDGLIREAIESGEFDDLAGVGKPIPGAGKPDDEYWWFRDWVKRNKIDPRNPEENSSES